MTDFSSRWRRPATATLVGAGLVILGFLLAETDWRFLTLCALGTFGPGILRELGWVKDKDEFQMRAVHRAGYHAYLAGGLTAFVMVGIVRAAGGESVCRALMYQSNSTLPSAKLKNAVTTLTSSFSVAARMMSESSMSRSALLRALRRAITSASCSGGSSAGWM